MSQGSESHTHTHTQPLYGSLDPVRDNLGEPAAEGTFRHLLEQNEDNTGRRTNNPDGLPLIQTNWCPHICHPQHFYAGCPSLHNPPNLSWLGTGTIYAGLHTRWLGCSEFHSTENRSFQRCYSQPTSCVVLTDKFKNCSLACHVIIILHKCCTQHSTDQGGGNWTEGEGWSR